MFEAWLYSWNLTPGQRNAAGDVDDNDDPSIHCSIHVSPKMGRSDSLQCLQQKSCHLIHALSAPMRNEDEDDKRRNEGEDVIDTGDF